MAKQDVTLEQMLEAGAHFGHQVRRWNPKIASYLYGAKDGVHIFDLVKTREALLLALDTIKSYSSEGKVILLVGTKKQAVDKVLEVAQNTGIPYVNWRWLGGTLTNFEQMTRSINELAEIKDKMESGGYVDLTKKERLLIQRKIDKMEQKFGGIKELKKLPDLMVIIDIKKEKSAVAEAEKAGVPVVGIVDSNADPEDVDWPIPMNDDATKSIDFVLELIEKAVLEGKETKVKVKK